MTLLAATLSHQREASSLVPTAAAILAPACDAGQLGPVTTKGLTFAIRGACVS